MPAGRRDLEPHHRVDVAAQRRNADRAIDGLEAGGRTEIGERRVAAVQHPQLHAFERCCIGDEARAAVLPLRSAGREPVLDDPVEERLGDHR